MIKPEQLAGDSEHSQQLALFCWAGLETKNYPQLKWLHAIPNANSHRQVSEGVRGGVPDICLPCCSWIGVSPVASPVHYGLYIELKIEKRRNQKNGGCSDDQIEWLEYLNEAGYKAVVCYGWKEAKLAIEEYLK